MKSKPTPFPQTYYANYPLPQPQKTKKYLTLPETSSIQNPIIQYHPNNGKVPDTSIIIKALYSNPVTEKKNTQNPNSKMNNNKNPKPYSTKSSWLVKII